MKNDTPFQEKDAECDIIVSDIAICHRLCRQNACKFGSKDAKTIAFTTSAQSLLSDDHDFTLAASETTAKKPVVLLASRNGRPYDRFREDTKMLVLSRKVGQRLVLDDNITIVINRIAGNRVQIGIEAPHEVHIMRGELDKIRSQFSDSDPTPAPPSVPATLVAEFGSAAEITARPAR